MASRVQQRNVNEVNSWIGAWRYYEAVGNRASSSDCRRTRKIYAGQLGCRLRIADNGL